jgi:hypothetical protein
MRVLSFPALLVFITICGYFAILPALKPIQGISSLYNSKLLLFFALLLVILLSVFALQKIWSSTALRRLKSAIEHAPAWQSVFMITFVAYMVAIISYAVAGPMLSQSDNPILVMTGDEPHYLIITQSLLEDHDILIQNNYDNGHYLAFYPLNLSKDLYEHSVRDVQGNLISIHGIGLPLILCVPFALAGYLGARILIALIGALSACVMLKLLMRLGFSRKTSLLAVLPAFIVSPLIFYGYSIFTEMVSLLIVLLSMLVLLDVIDGRSISSLKCLGAGACLAFLPWLGVKYGIITVAFAIAFLYYYLKKKAQLPQLLAVILPVAISVLLFEGMIYQEFGSLNPVKVYSGIDTSYGPNTVVYTGGAFLDRLMAEARSIFSPDVNTIIVSIFNRFFDEKDGIVLLAPIYLLSLGGFIVYLRKPLKGISKSAILVMTLLMLPYLFLYASTTSVGGYCPPSRTIVPLIGPAIVFMAIGLDHLYAGGNETYYALLVSLSLAIVAFMFLNPYSIYRHDMLSILNPIAIDLTKAFPSFIPGDPISAQPFFCIGFWTGIALVAYILMVRRASSHGNHLK